MHHFHNKSTSHGCVPKFSADYTTTLIRHINTIYGTDHDELAQFKYLCKFAAHRVFEMLGLCLCHLST